MVAKAKKTAAPVARQRRTVETPKRPAKLFISEWMTKQGFSDQTLGKIMGVSRNTVFRWRTEQHRLDPEKLARLAHELGVQPEELWRPPGRRSVDAILKDATDKQVEDAVDFVNRFVIKREEPAD